MLFENNIRLFNLMLFTSPYIETTHTWYTTKQDTAELKTFGGILAHVK